MANKRDIKRRIGSVANTQKITRAMKLVAAAKFARASHAVNASRPYSEGLDEMVSKLVASVEGEIGSALVQQQPVKKALLVVFGTDRGLCGSLNTAVFKEGRTWLDKQKSEGIQCDVLGFGRKAISWCKKQSENSLEGFEKVLDKPNFLKASELAKGLVKRFTAGEYEAIYLVNSVFINALTQKPVTRKFLPVSLENAAPENREDFIIEPGLASMIDQLLTKKLSTMIFQAMLDGAASEHGSRMTAMDNATNNANEVRKKLTLQYNRARQASITKELIEIVSGAEAL